MRKVILLLEPKVDVYDTRWVLIFLRRLVKKIKRSRTINTLGNEVTNSTVKNIKRIHLSPLANITTDPDSLEFICYQAVQGEQMRSQFQW